MYGERIVNLIEDLITRLYDLAMYLFNTLDQSITILGYDISILGCLAGSFFVIWVFKEVVS